MKRLISFITVVLLLCLCVSGCDSTDSTDNYSTDVIGNQPEVSVSPSESTAAVTETTAKVTTDPVVEQTTAPTTDPATEQTTAPVTEPPHTHNFSAATCTAPKTCSCGATEGSAIGHAWKDATCSKPKTCTVCGTTEGSAAGHSWKAATCSTPKTCAVCGATEGSAAGHNWKAATCSTPKTCAVCGTTEGSAAGHSWKAATYTSPKACTVCGVTEGDPLDVPGKENYHGHVYTGGESSKKYHYEAECPGKNSHEITWDEVERRSLGPCGTCVLK